MPSEPFRFQGAQYPSWMQGKTADEVAAMTTNLYNAYQQSQQMPSGTPAPNPQPTAVPGNPSSSSAAPDPNLIYNDPAEYQRQYDAYIRGVMQAQMQQYATPIVSQSAESAKEFSKLGQHADVWKRWEPEIELQMQGIPHHLRTKALYDQAAQIVRANHLDELAQERANQLIAQANTGTERAPNGSAPPTSAAIDKLDEAWDSGHPYFEGLKREQMTKQQIREFLAKTGQTADEYVKNATLGNLIPTRDGLTRASA